MPKQTLPARPFSVLPTSPSSSLTKQRSSYSQVDSAFLPSSCSPTLFSHSHMSMYLCWSSPLEYHLSSHSENFFKRFYLCIIFLQMGKGGRKRGRETLLYERHIQLVASPISPTGDLAHNPGMRPDWEPNQRPFILQAGTQSTEPRQAGLILQILTQMFSSLTVPSSGLPCTILIYTWWQIPLSIHELFHRALLAASS